MNTSSLFPPGAIPQGPRPSYSNATLIIKWDMWILDSGTPQPGRWAGFCLPRAKAALSGYLEGDETPMDIFAGYCRLLDEMNILITANSKTALIREIAKGCEEAQQEAEDEKLLAEAAKIDRNEGPWE